MTIAEPRNKNHGRGARRTRKPLTGPGAKLCTFFNRKGGCKKGDACWFKHVYCRCRNGNSCKDKESCHFHLSHQRQQQQEQQEQVYRDAEPYYLQQEQQPPQECVPQGQPQDPQNVQYHVSGPYYATVPIQHPQYPQQVSAQPPQSQPQSQPQQDLSPRKQEIGEKIFPRVQEREPKLAGKITGMLLELDYEELSILIKDEAALEAKITEALETLWAYLRTPQ